MMTHTPQTSALSNLTVIDMSRILAGPFAAQNLADMGAKVLKIEHPKGDDTRKWGPPFVTRADGSQDAAYYFCANRNKTNIALDFTQAADRERLLQLIQSADILIENYKVGGLAKYGLDYASIRALNPSIIYCSITGFGQNGPYKDRPGYDALIQAMGGLMSITGEAEQAPQKVGVAVEIHTLSEDCTEEKLGFVISRLNKNAGIDGILLFRPLPKNFDEEKIYL